MYYIDVNAVNQIDGGECSQSSFLTTRSSCVFVNLATVVQKGTHLAFWADCSHCQPDARW